MPVDGAPVARKMLGDAFDRTASARQQRADQFADLVIPLLGPDLDRVDVALHIARHRRICGPERVVEVARGQSNRVELCMERDVTAKELPMVSAMAWRRVHEANFDGSPVAAEQEADDDVYSSDRQFR